VFRVVVFIVLTLVLAAALVIALVGTSAVVKSWIHSDRSMTKFEAHIRHYTDRIIVKGDTWYVDHVAHPFVLFLGGVGGAWFIAAASALALGRLLMRAAAPKSNRWSSHA
jgi:hypothetical protein